MKLIPAAMALVLAAVSAQADPTNTVAPAKIGAAEASQHYDQEMIVTGKVAQVTFRPTIVFINLDKPFPNSPFAAVIHSDHTNQFTNLRSLRDKPVEIRGTIKNYRNKPEIVLETADQLRVPASDTNTPAAGSP